MGSPSTSFNIQPSYPMKQQTLQDLRDDEEFAKVSERFLTSLGKGDTPDDLFEYFRGADFNLADATKLYSKSKNFTEQQKLDYIYLRNKFDNASVGGLAERLKVTADITGEMLTDPVTAASVLFIPWTGGASIAARVAGGKAVQAGLKKLAGQQITKNLNQVGTKIPFQKLKTPLTKKGTAAILATEGFAYGSIDDYMRQGIEIETDQRARRDTGQTLAAGVITGAGAAGLYGLGLAATRLPKFQKALQDRRIDRIDNNDNYKADIIDTGSELLDKTTDFTAKAFGLFTKPTSRFIGRMKKSKTLEELVKIFRYDADKRFVASELGKQKRLGFSFNEDLQELVGNFNEELFDIINPLKTKGTIQVPAIGSRDAFFKLPFGQRAKTKITKEGTTIFGNPKQVQRLDSEVNDDLFYYLNTEKITKVVNGKEVPLNKDVVKAGIKLRRLLDKVRNTAEKEGVDIYRRTNYFPRKYIVAELQDELVNPGTLTQEIMRTQNISESQALKIIQDMIDNRTFFGASIMDVVKDADAVTRLPGLSKERVFSDIDDVKISKYLDTDIETVLADYIHQSSALIARKKYFGINVAEFKERYIDKIQAELGAGNRLSAREIKDLVNIYKVTTGQQDPIKSPVTRAILDGATVINQMALLPFATITSLSEIAVPILKGAGKKGIQRGKGKADVGKGGTRIMFESIFDYGKFWWNDIVQEVADVRSKNLVELNRLNRAMTTAGQDRALAMFGQGVTQKATQAQNVFFKYNLLHDWTRFVQLTSYEVGKSKIYENLYSLANKNLSKTQKLRLQDELNELGVDIEAGIKWVKDGANPHGIFYKRNFTKSAARYVDEVVMNPTAASNQKPLLHSYVTTRWLFGLMGFPTAFSNTVLKNGIRDITRDVRQFSKGRFTTPGIARVASGVLTMTAVGAFGNILRTGGKELDKVENGEISFGEFIGNASRRTGLWGPLEQYARIEDNRRYRTLPDSVLRNLAGPVIGDIIDAVDRSGRTSLQIVVSKIPGVTVLRSTNPQAYEDLMQWARENDFLQPTFEKEDADKGPVRPRPAFQVGGLVTQSEFDLIQSVGEDIVSGKLQEEVKDYVTEREKQRDISEEKIKKGLAEKDYRAAFEAYETLPIGQQMLGYFFPPTGVPISATGTAVYTERANPRMKTVGEYIKGIVKPSVVPLGLRLNPVTVDDPLSAGIAGLEATGVIPAAGAITKAGAAGLKRFRKPIKSTDDFDGEGGGTTQPPVNKEKEIYTTNSTNNSFSPVLKALLVDTPNQKGENLLNWLKKQDGVKKEELDLLEIEQYVAQNPKASGAEIAESIKDNKIKINLRIAKGEDAKRIEYDYEVSREDPITGQPAYIEYDYPDEASYLDNPFYQLTPRLQGMDAGRVYAYGNDDVGFEFFIDGRRLTSDVEQYTAGDRVYSRTEAEIRLNQLMEDEGIVDTIDMDTGEALIGEGFGDSTKYRYVVDTNLPGGKNYQEIIFLAKGDLPEFNTITDRMFDRHPEGFHFKGTRNNTQFAHALVRDRIIGVEKLKSLHIDELQSDIHKLGKQYGYLTDSDINKILEMEKVGVESIQLVDNILLDPDYDKLISKVADLPYKNNWQEVSLNQLLYKAAKEGYDSLSISTSDILVDRYTKKYSEFYKNLYDKRYKKHMKKLANTYKGKFTQSQYDLLDINSQYNNYLDKRARNVPLSSTGADFMRRVEEGLFDVNAIIITDKMRDLILKEGLPSFAEGGIVRQSYFEGEQVSKDFPVTDVKETAADRVDPFTGEPYSDQMARLGFNQGGGDMTRVDGTKKSSQGWLGPIKNNVTGQIMTEISMGIGPEDSQKLIPLLVPTLTQKEIEILQNMEIEGNIKNIPQSIKDKAIQHAKQREEKGLNVFYEEE